LKKPVSGLAGGHTVEENPEMKKAYLKVTLFE